MRIQRWRFVTHYVCEGLAAGTSVWRERALHNLEKEPFIKLGPLVIIGTRSDIFATCRQFAIRPFVWRCGALKGFNFKCSV